MYVWQAEYESFSALGRTKKAAMKALKTRVDDAAKMNDTYRADGPLPDDHIYVEKELVHD